MRFLKYIANNPMEGIGRLLAGGLIIYAIGIFLTTVTGVAASSPAAVLDNDLTRYLISVFYVSCALPYLLRGWRGIKAIGGASYLFVGFLFVTLLRLITVGWYPLTWWFSTLVACTAGIIYLWEKAGDFHARD